MVVGAVAVCFAGVETAVVGVQTGNEGFETRDRRGHNGEVELDLRPDYEEDGGDSGVYGGSSRFQVVQTEGYCYNYTEGC